MKEIAFKKQAELEDIYVRAHIEIDSEAAREKIMALIDSGDVEPTELLADMDNQIAKAKEEALSRKEILDKVEKWMSACEEESWLDDYNRVILTSFCSELFTFWCMAGCVVWLSFCVRVTTVVELNTRYLPRSYCYNYLMLGIALVL